MTAIIRPHTYHGKFINDDPKYQMITWSDIWQIRMIACRKTKKDKTYIGYGSEQEMKRLYNLNKDSCAYIVLSQVRILGDGSRDTCAEWYKCEGPEVADDFEFSF